MSRRRRFFTVAVGALVAVWAAVRLVLILAPPVREAWVVIGVGIDTDVFFARLSVASTGFYDGQLTTRVFWLPQEGETAEHRAMYAPTTLGVDGVASGPDALLRGQDGTWHLDVGGDGVLAWAQVTGQGGACGGTVGELTGTLGLTPSDNAGSYQGGALLRGPGVVVHTRAVGRVKGRALYVLGNEVAVGIDPLADCPAWAVVAGQRWVGTLPALPAGPQGQIQVGPWVVTYRATRVGASADGHAHLLAVERWLADAVGWPSPTLELLRVSAHVSGPGIDGPRTGVLLVRDTSL